MHRHRRLLSLAAALLVLAAACSESASASPTPSMTSTRVGCLDQWPASGKVTTTGPIPQLVNSDLAPGDTRLLLGLIDSAGYPLNGSQWSLTAQLYNLATDGCTPLAAAAPLTFEWAIKDVSGFFVAPATLPTGLRDMGIAVSGTNETGAPVSIHFAAAVAAYGIAPHPGDLAPTIATPIATNDPHGLAGVSTDSTPLARLYERSAADLLAAGKPFMIVFASPAFCTSLSCGPTLTTIKEVAPAFKKLAIIHVEPYIMEWNGTRMAPVMATGGGLQPNPIAVAWQLPIEPWIFTVDAQGRIVRSIEGVVGAAELRAALAEIAKK